MDVSENTTTTEYGVHIADVRPPPERADNGRSVRERSNLFAGRLCPRDDGTVLGTAENRVYCRKFNWRLFVEADDFMAAVRKSVKRSLRFTGGGSTLGFLSVRLSLIVFEGNN